MTDAQPNRLEGKSFGNHGDNATTTFAEISENTFSESSSDSQ